MSVKWQVKSLIASVIWIGLCFAGAHFIFPANTTPEQDAKLSGLLGEALGGGLVFIWVVFYLFGRGKKTKKSDTGRFDKRLN